MTYKSRPPLRPFTILGSAAALPERVLDNSHFVNELALQTSEEWIFSRTGIRERRVVSDAQTTATLAIDAAQSALLNANISADDLDIIIVATITPDTLTPSTASHVQQALRARNAFSFDINNACPGFIYGLDIASRYLADSQYHTAMIIGADVASRVVNYKSRDNCYFFGDGAGALVIRKAEGPHGLLGSRMETLADTQSLFLRGGGLQNLYEKNGPCYLQMDGHAVKEFASLAFSHMIRKCCESTNLDLSDVDMIVPHQANQRILEIGAKNLEVPFEKVFVNLDRYGNTMSASTAIALHEYLEQKPHSDQTIAMVAFGAGLTSAACLLRI